MVDYNRGEEQTYLSLRERENVAPYRSSVFDENPKLSIIIV